MGKGYRVVRDRGRTAVKATNGLAETALEGMGKRMWSDQHQKLMDPSKPKRINPDSDEGRAVAAKYLAPK